MNLTVQKKSRLNRGHSLHRWVLPVHVFLLIAVLAACKKTKKSDDASESLIANPSAPLTMTKPAAGSTFKEQVVVEWSNATAGAPVKLGFANTESCNSSATIQQATEVTEGTTATLTFPDEGTVYLCVFQDLSAANREIAVGAPAAITFDKQAPGDFEITAAQPIIKAADENPLTILPVTWFPSNGASTYVVGISKTSKCANDVAQTEVDAPITNAELSGLTLNQTDDYYLCVSAKDDAGNITNAKNNAIKFFIDGRAPTTPVLSTLTTAGTGAAVTITATWRLAADRGRAGVKRYDLKLVNNSTSVETLLTVDSPTATASSSASPSTTYDAFVRARDGAGNASPWSTSTQVTTGP